MKKQRKTNPHLAPLSDEERALMWKEIQGLCALVLLENKGHDIKLKAQKGVKP